MLRWDIEMSPVFVENLREPRGRVVAQTALGVSWVAISVSQRPQAVSPLHGTSELSVS